MFGDIVNFFGKILRLIVAVHTQWFRLIHLLWSSTSSVGAAKNTKAPPHQLPAAPPGKKWRSIGNGFEEYYRERVEEVEGLFGLSARVLDDFETMDFVFKYVPFLKHFLI